MELGEFHVELLSKQKQVRAKINRGKLEVRSEGNGGCASEEKLREREEM